GLCQPARRECCCIECSPQIFPDPKEKPSAQYCTRKKGTCSLFFLTILNAAYSFYTTLSAQVTMAVFGFRDKEETVCRL
uniref:Uncharacterized protein n=1 Tax=Ficedula albicollis TaxID=59894 RepID=A0A803W0M3_FICAL